MSKPGQTPERYNFATYIPRIHSAMELDTAKRFLITRAKLFLANNSNFMYSWHNWVTEYHDYRYLLLNLWVSVDFKDSNQSRRHVPKS